MEEETTHLLLPAPARVETMQVEAEDEEDAVAGDAGRDAVETRRAPRRPLNYERLRRPAPEARGIALLVLCSFLAAAGRKRCRRPLPGYSTQIN